MNWNPLKLKEGTTRHTDSDSDLCIEDTGSGRGVVGGSSVDGDQNSVGGRVSIRLVSDMACYKPRD